MREIEIECGCEEIIVVEIEPGEGPLVGDDDACESCGCKYSDTAWTHWFWMSTEQRMGR